MGGIHPSCGVCGGGGWYLSREKSALNQQKRKDMNKLQMKGNWNITKGKLKQKWASLTDDDLRYQDGQEDELIGRIQKRTGQTREAVERAIDEAFD
jgi:uncharacterized protein YjbJ (UPF0337 family)